MLTWLTADSAGRPWDVSLLRVMLKYGMRRGATAGVGPLLDVLQRNLSLKEGRIKSNNPSRWFYCMEVEGL